jgi:N-acetylglucosaminyl-diphospho-decaprenol L-rhamnosyltransferase
LRSPRLIIVILNFRDTQVTIDCLHTLAPCHFWASNEAKVVIWENGTGADAVKLLEQAIGENRWQDWVELNISPDNLGFTGGNNRVMEASMNGKSPPEYFLLLNSDTLVTEPSIRSLIEFMDAHPQAGICGSQLLSKSGEIQASPFRFPGVLSEFDSAFRLGPVSRLLAPWNVVMPPPAEACSVDWVSGASMMLRRTMLEQIGLLDEDFFTYFEDVDLCKRANESGWQVWFTPESKVVHLEGASSGIVKRIIKRRPDYWFCARRRYYLKNYGSLHAALIDAANIIGFALWRLRRFIQNKPDNDPPKMLYDSIRHSVFVKGFTPGRVSLDDINKANVPSAQYRYEHLLVLPVPFRRQGEAILVEAQALHGLKRWLDSFANLAVAAPVIPEEIAVTKPEMEWLLPDKEILDRVHLAPLPWAYRPDQFILALPGAVKILSGLIRESRYLQFAIGGFWGDWAAVAAELAITQHRRFSVHTDRVEHAVLRRLAVNLGLYRRLRTSIDALLMEKWHQRIIGHCALGLFHGQDTYNTYKAWMKSDGQAACAHNIHNIHDIETATEKLVRPTKGSESKNKSTLLNILYAGRLAPEKAPLDWVEALTWIKSKGLDFKAIWAGDGPLKATVEVQLRERKLTKNIQLTGFISDRSEVGRLYRNADVFVFTHITPESPRCLLEALRFGVPIIGYQSAFAEDLISKFGGGVLVPCGDHQALGEALVNLASDTAKLTKLKQRAVKDGERFTSKAVFSERSELIKKYLP